MRSLRPAPPTAPRTARRRRPGALLGTVVVLGVLAGGSVLAGPTLDTAVRSAAERRVAQQLQREIQAAGPVEVSIGGRWFVPQVVHGAYPQVSVRAAGVPAGGCTLRRVDAELHGVEVPLRDVLQQREQPVRIASATAHAELDLVELNRHLAARAAGVQVTGASPGGPLRVTGTRRVVGHDVSLSGEVDLVVEQAEGGELRGVPRALETGNSLVDRLSGSLPRKVREGLAFTVPLHDLPLQQRLTGVQVVSDGLVLTTEGHDIVVRS